MIADGRTSDTRIEPTSLIGADLEEKFHERTQQMARALSKTMCGKNIPTRKTNRGEVLKKIEGTRTTIEPFQRGKMNRDNHGWKEVGANDTFPLPPQIP